MAIRDKGTMECTLEETVAVCARGRPKSPDLGSFGDPDSRPGWQCAGGIVGFGYVA
jgi:hypothetical protein